MTTVARRVLEDCRSALDELREDPKSEEWRRRWVTMLTLLRAVGHALANADGITDAVLADIIDRHWRRINDSRPEPEIFWMFIDEERNNILKEYKVNAGINVTVRPGTKSYNLKTGEAKEIAPSQPTLHDYVINSGPFKGQDQRDVVAYAIDWWDSYLTEIEDEYAERNI